MKVSLNDTFTAKGIINARTIELIDPTEVSLIDNLKKEAVDFLCSTTSHLMEVAATLGMDKTINNILKAESSHTLKTSFGSRALHIAVYFNRINMVNLLLQAGFNIDMLDPEGNTPLHLAVRKGHNNLVRILLDKGANTNIDDSAGLNALELAAITQRNDKAVELLCVYGAVVKDFTKIDIMPYRIYFEEAAVADRIYALDEDWLLKAAPNIHNHNGVLLSRLKNNCIRNGLPHNYQARISNSVSLSQTVKSIYLTIFAGWETKADDIVKRIEASYCGLLHFYMKDCFQTPLPYNELVKYDHSTPDSRNDPTIVRTLESYEKYEQLQPTKFIKSMLFAPCSLIYVLGILNSNKMIAKEFFASLKGVTLPFLHHQLLKQLEYLCQLPTENLNTDPNNYLTTRNGNIIHNDKEQLSSFVATELKRRKQNPRLVLSNESMAVSALIALSSQGSPSL